MATQNGVNNSPGIFGSNVPSLAQAQQPVDWWYAFYNTSGPMSLHTGPSPYATTTRTIFAYNQSDAQSQAESIAQQNGWILTNLQGPYKDKATAAAAGKAAKAAADKAAQSGSINIPNPLSGLDAIGNFFGKLGESSTWMRVGEVLIGLIILGIGVNALFDNKPLQIVTKTAGVAALAIPK